MEAADISKNVSTNVEQYRYARAFTTPPFLNLLALSSCLLQALLIVVFKSISNIKIAAVRCNAIGL